MRYWGYLVGKLGVSAAVTYGLLRWLNYVWPAPPQFLNYAPPRFGYDLQYTMLTGLWFLLGCGLLYLCIWDQKLRCRVCLRRLRMPVETGSWSGVLLLGRPRIEYICPYGHGTLKLAELQISGLENPEWNPHGEIWDELCASARDVDERP
ncbi:MAG: hypothetical protein ABSH50_11670 [Bryobacteraceae bacterium]|jgi:hypothetical protein